MAQPIIPTPKILPDYRWRWMMFRRDLERLKGLPGSMLISDVICLIMMCHLMEFILNDQASRRLR